MAQARKYIAESMGSNYAENVILDLEKTWEESDNKTPLINFLSMGSDPTSLIENLAKRHKFGTYYVTFHWLFFRTATTEPFVVCLFACFILSLFLFCFCSVFVPCFFFFIKILKTMRKHVQYRRKVLRQFLYLATLPTLQGPVVQKPVNVNLGLKVNQEYHFFCCKAFALLIFSCSVKAVS